MSGVRALEGVDNTLVNLASDAVGGLSPRPSITNGPLDREDDTLRLNWFLYAIRPNPAFRNMEHPRVGSTTSRGFPPLALELDYVLTAHPGPLTASGQEAQFANRGLAAVMQALHQQSVIADGSAFLAAEARPLLEPLRITLAALDLDGLSKLWTSVSQPMRTTVGYRVSLVTIDDTRVHVPGPPVRERRFAVVPSAGAGFESVSPSRVSAGQVLSVEVRGAVGALGFSLRRQTGDPAGSGDWPLVAAATGPGQFGLAIGPPTLAPGARQVSMVGDVDGLPAGGDATAVTLVPVVLGTAGPVAGGATATLDTAHAAADVEVFFDGVALDPADVTFVSAVRVDIAVPATATPGTHQLALRAGRTAGPVFDGLLVT